MLGPFFGAFIVLISTEDLSKPGCQRTEIPRRLRDRTAFAGHMLQVFGVPLPLPIGLVAPWAHASLGRQWWMRLQAGQGQGIATSGNVPNCTTSVLTRVEIVTPCSG